MAAVAALRIVIFGFKVRSKSDKGVKYRIFDKRHDVFEILFLYEFFVWKGSFIGILEVTIQILSVTEISR